MNILPERGIVSRRNLISTIKCFIYKRISAAPIYDPVAVFISTSIEAGLLSSQARTCEPWEWSPRSFACFHPSPSCWQNYATFISLHPRSQAKAALITVQLPCNYIWKNNFSSHFRAYLWKDFSALFSDNLSEKFTSCLIKASEIRASSNKKTFAASMKWKYLLWYANPKMKHHTIISQSHSSTTTTTTTATTTTTSLIKNAWQELTSKHSGVEANKNV